LSINRIAKQRGLTLVELMVAMVLGLFLMIGAMSVFTQGRQHYQSAGIVARLQENIRFAFDVLENDIRLAGFWGQHNIGANTNVSGVAVVCGPNIVTAWALDTLNPVQATNNMPDGSNQNVVPNCSAFGDGVIPNTDVLVVRHASGQPQAFTNGRVQIQSDLGKAMTFSDGALPLGFVANESTTHDVVVNAWYLSAGSNTLDDVPSLRRRTLINSTMVDEEVIAGVENMQIQFGVDTDNDGSIERFVDPDNAVVAGNQVLSVRIWLLMRSEYTERGFTDGKTYVLPDAVLADFVPNDNFRRMQASKTIMLRNTRG
jgi:type IV pilus assembly protein PilW